MVPGQELPEEPIPLQGPAGNRKQESPEELRSSQGPAGNRKQESPEDPHSLQEPAVVEMLKPSVAEEPV